MSHWSPQSGEVRFGGGGVRKQALESLPLPNQTHQVPCWLRDSAKANRGTLEAGLSRATSRHSLPMAKERECGGSGEG